MVRQLLVFDDTFTSQSGVCSTYRDAHGMLCESGSRK